MYGDEETTGDYWHAKNRNAFIMKSGREEKQVKRQLLAA